MQSKNRILPNGATLISRAQTRDNTDIVLAMASDGMGGVQYITWACRRNTEDTYTGHYFHEGGDGSSGFMDAVADYSKRIERGY